MKNAHPKHERSIRLLQGGSAALLKDGSAALLKSAGLRPTCQRLALADWLFRNPNKHPTVEQAHAAMNRTGVGLSLATVYNTLNCLAAAGLVRQISIDGGPAWFDANPEPHHYLYNEKTGALTDIPVLKTAPPKLPKGAKLARIDIIVRLRE